MPIWKGFHMILTNPQMFSLFQSSISPIFYKEKGKTEETERKDEMLMKWK